MTKEEKIHHFDPDAPGNSEQNIYGLPFSEEESDIVLLPVPWDVTTSYGKGTAKGPAAIYDASFQVDLFDPHFPDTWKHGIFMYPPDKEIKKRSKQLGKISKDIIKHWEHGGEQDEIQPALDTVNAASEELNQWVYEQTTALLKAGKKVGLIGGEHSVPLGYYKAIAEKHGDFSILQIDAHADLRPAYEGFEYSHASIMFNAMNISQLQKLVQVGIRDCGPAERQMIEHESDRIATFFDWAIDRRLAEGETLKAVTDDIIGALGDKVYVSFDIDGLEPSLCPNTGTPVPGGPTLGQITYLLTALQSSGKQIIGFDLCEVSPGKHDEWDANVGARVLFKLCGLLAYSR